MRQRRQRDGRAPARLGLLAALLAGRRLAVGRRPARRGAARGLGARGRRRCRRGGRRRPDRGRRGRDRSRRSANDELRVCSSPAPGRGSARARRSVRRRGSGSSGRPRAPQRRAMPPPPSSPNVDVPSPPSRPTGPLAGTDRTPGCPALQPLAHPFGWVSGGGGPSAGPPRTGRRSHAAPLSPPAPSTPAGPRSRWPPTSWSSSSPRSWPSCCSSWRSATAGRACSAHANMRQA